MLKTISGFHLWLCLYTKVDLFPCVCVSSGGGAGGEVTLFLEGLISTSVLGFLTGILF